MCGLFGWFLNEKPTRGVKAGLRLLSILNSLRGSDSWGVFAEGMDRPHRTVGCISRSSNRELGVFSGRRWAIGHTRKATTGKVVEQNAHPFDMGDVVGAHNGMVFNHEELNYLYDRDYAVDSQHIFGHIADGIGTFADVEAYGAISFTSKEGPSGIYLGTFNEGELAVANVPEVGTFWSSDVRHLDMALSSMRFHKVRYYKLREGACYDVEPNGLWLNSMELDFASPWRTYSTALMKETGSVT